MQSNISTKYKTEFPERIHLPECQSTNDELMALAQSKRDEIPEGFVLSTDFQSAGRGQRGSVWVSDPGCNLLFSIYLRPQFLEARFAFRLSASIALGIALVLEEHCPDLKLKWPNDIFSGNRKMGGILIETALSGMFVDRVVAGIGLNINQTGLPGNAISLLDITGKTCDREELLNKIRNSVLNQYTLLANGGWDSIRSKYISRLYRLAIPAQYSLPDGSGFMAVLKSIGEQGELILLCKDGEKKFQFKEVVFEV